VGGAALSYLDHALKDSLEKSGVGPPRGGQSRVSYPRGGTVERARPPNVRRMMLRRAKSTATLLRDGGAGRTVRTLADRAAAEVADGYAYEEESPVVSQVAKDVVSNLAECALDHVPTHAISDAKALLSTVSSIPAPQLSHLDSVNTILSSLHLFI